MEVSLADYTMVGGKKKRRKKKKKKGKEAVEGAVEKLEPIRETKDEEVEETKKVNIVINKAQEEE